MKEIKIIAATGCPTGIAHTYMAKEALEIAAKKRNVAIKVETHGQGGVENALTQEEINEAFGVIIAADKDVHIERFSGKRLLNVPVSKGMKDADELIRRIVEDTEVPVYQASSSFSSAVTQTKEPANFWHQIYVYLMNGVSHMLPLVVAGGVLIALSFFWGIHSSEVESPEYNSFAALLMTVGGYAMNLMVPVLCAYIAEAIGKRSGLVIGFATGMIAFSNGTGFLGGILGGFLAGYTVVLLQKIFEKLPKSLDGLKQIFLFPVLGVFISGAIMWYLSSPMKNINEAMMTFLKSMENSNPIVLGILVGIMCAADFGGPINKAAYLTGTALLAQGNYYFMAGVSAACIAPPIATGFAVLLNKKAYSDSERNAGYVNFLLGSTHITEGAIPFAAKNPLLNLPIFMLGSAVASTLTYLSKITVPAPHGGFIVLPLVNKPFLWVIYILIGAFVSGILLALVAGRQAKKHAAASEEKAFSFVPFLQKNQIKIDVEVENREELLHYLTKVEHELGLIGDEEKIYAKYLEREAQGTTGMENGIAIPHAKDETIVRETMLIVKLKNPIEWETFDQSPVDTIVTFLLTENGEGEHLRALSEVATRLMNEEFVADLKKATTTQAIYDLFVS